MLLTEPAAGIKQPMLDHQKQLKRFPAVCMHPVGEPYDAVHHMRHTSSRTGYAEFGPELSAQTCADLDAVNASRSAINLQ